MKGYQKICMLLNSLKIKPRNRGQWMDDEDKRFIKFLPTIFQMFIHRYLKQSLRRSMKYIMELKRKTKERIQKLVCLLLKYFVVSLYLNIPICKYYVFFVMNSVYVCTISRISLLNHLSTIRQSEVGRCNRRVRIRIQNAIQITLVSLHDPYTQCLIKIRL